MCGIAGLISNSSESKGITTLTTMKKVFRELMFLSQRRGNAASGIFSSSTNSVGEHTVQTLRSPLRAEEMLKSAEGSRMVDSYSNYSNFLIGHTRASSGASARNNYNNHPHVCGDIIGVHNGLIDTEQPIKTLQGKFDLKGSCDSEVLFALINSYKNKQTGTRTAVKEALLNIKGWYTLVFMDVKKPSEIHIIRDSGSPLCSVWWPKANSFIIASEQWMLDEVVEKFGLVDASNQMIMDKVLFTLDTSRSSSDGMINRSTMYINPKDNREYIEENKVVYEATQGR